MENTLVNLVSLTVDLAKELNIDVIHGHRGLQALQDFIVALRANRRSGTASVKTKATVNLSGRKPWRQKGTGRARAGYFSSPVWVGGGVVHGPHPRSYAKHTPKSVKKLAFHKALSLRILSGDILLVDHFDILTPKTKIYLAAVSVLKEKGSSSLLTIGSYFSNSLLLAARNISQDLLMNAHEVNAENILAFDKIVLIKSSVDIIRNRILL